MNQGWQNNKLLKRVFGALAGRSANSAVQIPEKFLTRFPGERIGEKQRRFFRWFFFRGKIQARMYSPLKFEFLLPFRWMSQETPAQIHPPGRRTLVKQLLSNRLTQLQIYHQHSTQQRTASSIIRSFPVFKRFYIDREKKVNIAGGVTLSDTTTQENLALLPPGRSLIEGVRSRVKFNRPRTQVINVRRTALKTPLDTKRERTAQSFPFLKTIFRETRHYLPNVQRGSRENEDNPENRIGGDTFTGLEGVYALPQNARTREYHFDSPCLEDYPGFSPDPGLTYRLPAPADRGQTASLSSGQLISMPEQPSSRGFIPATNSGNPTEQPELSNPVGISEQPGADKVLRQGDVNWVAEEVYTRIEKKLRVECESKGIFF